MHTLFPSELPFIYSSKRIVMNRIGSQLIFIKEWLMFVVSGLKLILSLIILSFRLILKHKNVQWMLLKVFR